MPTIVEALKTKYPDATGNTIADVIKNSGSEPEPTPGTEIRVIDAFYNPTTENWNLDITTGELVELMTSGVIVFAKIEREGTFDEVTQHALAFSQIHSCVQIEGGEDDGNYTFFMNEINNMYGWWVGYGNYLEGNPWWQED